MLAENDRDVYRRSQAMLAREKEIMKDVDGWEVSLAPLGWLAKRTKVLKFVCLHAGWQERLQHLTIHSLKYVSTELLSL